MSFIVVSYILSCPSLSFLSSTVEMILKGRWVGLILMMVLKLIDDWKDGLNDCLP